MIEKIQMIEFLMMFATCLEPVKTRLQVLFVLDLCDFGEHELGNTCVPQSKITHLTHGVFRLSERQQYLAYITVISCREMLPDGKVKQ